MDEFNIVVENEEPIDVTINIQNDFLKGDKGDKGDSNSLTIGTVEKGEEASASIRGESPNQILDLVLPKGDKGDKGDKPEKGIDYFTTEEKQEIVQEVIEEVNAFDIKIVEELPTQDIKTKIIYFVPKVDEEEQNIYDEYIYINNQWEHIGSTKVDLTDYYKKEETDEIIDNKAIVDKTIISGKTEQEGTPSPTNIVPIKNVNVYGVNEFDKNINFKVGYFTSSGSIASGGSSIATEDYIKIKKNTNYILSAKGLETICFYDATKTFIKKVNLSSSTYSFNDTAEYIRIQFTTSVLDKETIKLEKGTTATTYTSYNYGSLDLNLQKDTNTKTVTLISKRLHEDDYINENGFYYNRETLVLDGTEDFEFWGNGTSSSYRLVYKNSANVIKKEGLILSNSYTKKTANELYEGIVGITIDTSGNIIIHDSRFTTLEAWKTHLANQYTNGTPITIEYQLATTEKEEFNETNQIAWNTLEDLFSQGYTFVNSSSDELQPILTLTEYTANEIYRENVEKIKELDNEINTIKQSNVKTYTSKGLSFRFERYGKLVEVVISGQLSEDITASANNDITIDKDFVPSAQKAELVMLQDTSTKPLFTLIAMTTGIFRWRSNTNLASGGWCTGKFMYLV